MFSEVCLQFGDICWSMAPLNTHHDCQGWWRHKQFIHLKSPVTLQQGVFGSWKFVFLKGGCSSNVWYHTLVENRYSGQNRILHLIVYLANEHSSMEFFCLLFPAVTVGYQWLPNGSALYFGVKLHSDHDWSLAVTNGNHWKLLNKKTPIW